MKKKILFQNENNNMTLKRIYHSVIRGLLSWKRFNPRRKKANHNIYLFLTDIFILLKEFTSGFHFLSLTLYLFSEELLRKFSSILFRFLLCLALFSSHSLLPQKDEKDDDDEDDDGDGDGGGEERKYNK